MNTDIERFENECQNGDLETVDALFDVVNGHDNVDMLKMRNISVKNGHLNILQFLHKKGVGIDQLCYYDDENPLLIASVYGWVDVLDYILLQPEIDINLRTRHGGWTALMYAAHHGRIDVIDRLLQNENCQINIQNNFGGIAIFYATQRGHSEIVDKLIVNGSDIWHIKRDGQTLLHYASRSKNKELLKRILSLGLDVNQQDICGWTPLMIAVKFSKKEDVEILLEYDADPRIKNNEGKTAWDYAKNEQIKNLLNQYIS